MSRRDLKRDLVPARRFEAARPNALHQYDTTVAAAWFENANGSIGYELETQRYKNKPGNKRPRLHMFSMIDDHSRVLWARVYRSENSHNMLDFSSAVGLSTWINAGQPMASHPICMRIWAHHCIAYGARPHWKSSGCGSYPRHPVRQRILGHASTAKWNGPLGRAC